MHKSKGITLSIVTYTKLPASRRRSARTGGFACGHEGNEERSGSDKMQVRVAVLKICATISDRTIQGSQKNLGHVLGRKKKAEKKET